MKLLYCLSTRGSIVLAYIHTYIYSLYPYEWEVKEKCLERGYGTVFAIEASVLSYCRTKRLSPICIV